MQENLPAGASLEAAAGYPPVVACILKNGIKLPVLEKNFAAASLRTPLSAR